MTSPKTLHIIAQHDRAAIPSRGPDPCIAYEVARLVATYADPSILDNMRLASRDLARAVDPVFEELCIADWGRKHVGNSPWMQYVRHVKILAAPKWAEVSRVAAWLPNLSSISIPCGVEARMPVTVAAALTRLDLGTDSNSFKDVRVPKQASLPGLRAASLRIGIHPVSLADVTRFAPNVEQLYCDGLMIGDFLGRLQKCTHYGGAYLLADDDDDFSATATAFAEAFPALEVLSRVPVITNDKHHVMHARHLVQSLRKHRKTLAAVHTMAAAPQLTAARCFGQLVPKTGDTTAVIRDHWAALQGLSVLSMHSTYDSIHSLHDIGQLKALQHVHLFLDQHPDGLVLGNYMPGWQQALQELGELSQLKSLALPAALLCRICCGVRKEQDRIAIEQELRNLACKGGLQQLAFLGIRRLDSVCSAYHSYKTSYETSYWRNLWPHCNDTDLQRLAHANRLAAMHAKLCQHAEEAAAKDPAQCVCKVILKLGLQRDMGACLDNLTGAGLWGLYGPAEF